MRFVLLFLSIIFSFHPQVETTTISPNGKYKVKVLASEESDLQTRYVTILIDLTANEKIEIANCIRRDLSAPNIYWDKNSEYLIFEQCSESFKDSEIKILNLTTKKVDLVLKGLIGNHDKHSNQFDAQNDILIYFETTIESTEIPVLSSFDIKTKKKNKLYEFETEFDMDFPEIKRELNKRMLTLTYPDWKSKQSIVKQIEY